MNIPQTPTEAFAGWSEEVIEEAMIDVRVIARQTGIDELTVARVLAHLPSWDPVESEGWSADGDCDDWS